MTLDILSSKQNKKIYIESVEKTCVCMCVLEYLHQNGYS